MKHKNILFVFFAAFILIPCWSAAQRLSYAYDSAGNRVSRTIEFPPPQSVKRQAKDTVSYYEFIGNKEIKLYPNPVQSYLTVNIAGYENDLKGEYSLIDYQGKVLTNGKIESDNFQISMSNYPSGNYLLNLVINGESSIWKLIKK